MNFRIAALVAGAVTLTAPAAAQPFNQAIVFGDSTVDSGFYKALPSPGGGPTFNAAWPAAVAAGAGAPTTNPGLMNSQVLAAYFGLSANPANQQGGTNFATSGAKNVLVNDGTNGGFQAAIPTVTQIANYLAGNGGRANPNGLYLISAGGNDVAFAFSGLPGSPATQAARIAYLTNAANGLSAAVSSLRNAGARTIIVPGQNFSFPANNAAERDARLAYTQALWSGLAAAGVNFIPADFNAVRVAIANNPLAFGFTNGVGNGINSTACIAPAGITTAYALLCSSNPAAPSHIRTADADRTFLFADDQHLTSAGQKIEADYFYSLIVAPSQISLLAENAVASRSATVAGIQEQIDIARRRPNAGLNLWISGDISSLKINNPAAGFPGDSATPFSGTVGMDYKWHNGALFGAAITTGTQTPGFEPGGRFKQKEIAGSSMANMRSANHGPA